MALNTITLEVAQLWAERWNKNPDVLKGIKAFKILGSNVTSIMKQPGIVDIRAYMGIRDDGTPTLIIVGVDAKGDDVIDPEKGHHVYDYTEPCPPCCNGASTHINPH
jgi:hypothetical protein